MEEDTYGSWEIRYSWDDNIASWDLQAIKGHLPTISLGAYKKLNEGKNTQAEAAC
jgi:hypothetical protein